MAMPRELDTAVGLVAAGVLVGRRAARAGLGPARAAYRSPLGAPWRAIAPGLAESGAATRRRAQAEAEAALKRALERESPRLERLLVLVLDSRLLLELSDRVIRSQEMQQLIGQIASSPELRAALAAQSTGLADEMAAGVRRRTATMDDVAERTVRSWLRRPRPEPS
jgi:hypothetical protein